jgi:hypothetical protein
MGKRSSWLEKRLNRVDYFPLREKNNDHEEEFDGALMLMENRKREFISVISFFGATYTLFN